MVERSSVRLRRLADSRVEDIRLGRWLSKAKVRLVEMERTAGDQIAARVAGLHVLAIQDSREVNCQVHDGVLVRAPTGSLSPRSKPPSWPP